MRQRVGQRAPLAALWCNADISLKPYLSSIELFLYNNSPCQFCLWPGRLAVQHTLTCEYGQGEGAVRGGKEVGVSGAGHGKETGEGGGGHARRRT